MGWASRYREVQAAEKRRRETTFGDDYGAEPTAPRTSFLGMNGEQVAVLGLGAIFLATIVFGKELKKRGG